MSKTAMSLATAVAMALPALGHAMILDEAVVASILGTRMPPSTVTVGTTKVPSFRSVHYFDNLINLTNRVLNRSIRVDIVAQHTNSKNGTVYTQAYKRGLQAVEKHCQLRLTADGIASPAKECGNGFTR